MLGKVLKPFVFLFLFVVLVGTACLGSSGGNTPTQNQGGQSGENNNQNNNQPRPSGASAVDNLDDVQKATFQIVATGTYEDPEAGEQLNAGWTGTGFFVDSSGLAVTNNHVVTGAALLKVYLNGESEPRNAKVVGVSECADLAVIDVSGDGYPFLDWYDGTVKTGLEVYAAGFPLSEPEFNLTKGIISKTNAPGETSWASLDYIYGHDATINGGNSGGPLVTQDGKVVGVNYMGRKAVDQYFAIPGDLAQPLVNDLKEGKNIAALGINGDAITFGPNGEYPGIWVYSTETGSPADKAGVLPGDIIHEIEDILVATDGSMKDYCDIIRGHDDTDTLKIRVYRWRTDELLLGEFNGKELAVEGTAGLSGGTGTTGSSGGSTGGTVSTLATEFDGDLTSEGWYTYILPSSAEDDTIVEQKPGRLYLELSEDNTNVYVFNDSLWGTDERIETTAAKVSGPNRFNISLVCRVSDLGWYEFSITTGGYWYIYKTDLNADNPYKVLEQGASKYIRVQGDSNTLMAECIGSELTFYANGEKIGEATDRDFTEGGVGINVSSLDLKGVKVEVENFYGELVQ